MTKMSAYDISDLFTFDSGTRQQSSEKVTPHKLSIMILVLNFKQMCIKEQNLEPRLMDSDCILTEKEKRDFMIMLLDLLQCADMDLKTLRGRIEPVLKPYLLDTLYETLNEFSKGGVNPIYNFFETYSTFLSQSAPSCVIRRESIMGIYIRGMELAFNEMSFSQVVETYKKVQVYFEAEFPASVEQDGENKSWCAARFWDVSESPLSMSNLEEKSTMQSSSGQSAYSKKQAEFFIANQSLLLSHNEGKALPPDQLQQKICSILSSNPDIAEAHFLNYINSLRVKEYCTSIHNLYHYFDRKAISPSDGNPKRKAASEEVAMRYAALNFASLQYRFGNKEECRAALQEAIRMAQESNDQFCLQHALVWLNFLQGNTMPINQLERSVKATIDLSLPSLVVLGYNSLSKQMGSAHEKPSKVVHLFTESNLTNCIHSNYGMMCSGFAQRGAMWNYYGKRELCSLDSQLILSLNTSVNGVYYNGDSVCIAMCNLAQHHADFGYYAAASEILNQAKSRFPPSTSYSEVWQLCQQRIAFTRALYNGKLTDAEQALVDLFAVDVAEAKIRQPILFREQGKITEAFDCLNALLKECDKEKGAPSAHYKCRVLMELANLFLASGNQSSAVMYVTHMIAVARMHYLELYASLGSAYLAYVQLHMCMPEQGIDLIESQLTRILTNACSFDKARVLHVYAKCKVAAAQKLTSSSRKKSEIVSALDLISTAINLFNSVEAHMREKDAYYFQAMVYNEIDQKESRNNCAHQFKKLDKLYPTVNSLTVNCV